MKSCVRSRWFASKEFLSQVFRKTAIGVACAALIFCAQPVLAQRGGGGGGHAGGGFSGGHGGGHASGGRSFAEGRAGGGHSFAGGGERSDGGMRGSLYSGARNSGIEVFSGAGSRSGFARGGSSESFPGAESVSGSVHDGIVSYAGAPRHTTVGFPRTGGSWQVPESAYHPGAPLDFAGQGRAVWQASSRETPNGGSSQSRELSSRSPGEFQRPVRGNAERGYGGDDNRFGQSYRDHDRDRFRFRRPLYPYGGYGGYGIYPWLYFGYSGFGNWSTCDQWTPDWDWQDEGCENNQPQIVAYGADGVYPAPDTVTDARLEGYIRQHPWVGDGSIASGASEQPSNSESHHFLQNGSARSNAAPDTLLYLADGSNYAITSYWLAGGELHYITSYGAEDAAPIGRVDLQRTVDANAARGVPFTLRPAPHAGSGAGRR